MYNYTKFELVHIENSYCNTNLFGEFLNIAVLTSYKHSKSQTNDY